MTEIEGHLGDARGALNAIPARTEAALEALGKAAKMNPTTDQCRIIGALRREAQQYRQGTLS